MIKAVIFDFDHTLYDRDASYTKMFARAEPNETAFLQLPVVFGGSPAACGR